MRLCLSSPIRSYPFVFLPDFTPAFPFSSFIHLPAEPENPDSDITIAPFPLLINHFLLACSYPLSIVLLISLIALYSFRHTDSHYINTVSRWSGEGIQGISVSSLPASALSFLSFLTRYWLSLLIPLCLHYVLPRRDKCIPTTLILQSTSHIPIMATLRE